MGFAIRQRRREFLRASLLGSGALLVSFDKLCSFAAGQKDDRDPFFGGQQLGVLGFTGESRAPLDTIIGSGLDARLFSDPSTLTPEQPVTPAEKFYIRTTAADLRDTTKPWTINASGLVEAPVSLRLDEIMASAKPMRLHLMECSGNTRETRFALLSVADWSFWWHTWTPKAPGTYSIRLRVTDPVVETKRLDSGHYVRSVEVAEI